MFNFIHLNDGFEMRNWFSNSSAVINWNKFRSNHRRILTIIQKLHRKRSSECDRAIGHFSQVLVDQPSGSVKNTHVNLWFVGINRILPGVCESTTTRDLAIINWMGSINFGSLFPKNC